MSEKLYFIRPPGECRLRTWFEPRADGTLACMRACDHYDASGRLVSSDVTDVGTVLGATMADVNRWLSE